MGGRSFSAPMGLRYKWCSFCKYCIPTYDKGKWICQADTKTYYTENTSENGEIQNPCINGKFEWDEEKFRGHRW